MPEKLEYSKGLLDQKYDPNIRWEFCRFQRDQEIIYHCASEGKEHLFKESDTRMLKKIEEEKRVGMIFNISLPRAYKAPPIKYGPPLFSTFFEE